MARHRHTPFRKRSFRLKIKQGTLFSITAIFLLGSALLIALSFTQQGLILLQINLWLIRTFSWTSIFTPVILGIVGLMFITKLKSPIREPNALVGLVLFTLAASGATRAGVLGQEIWFGLSSFITGVGAVIILIAASLVGILILFNISLDQLFEVIHKLLSARQKLPLAGIKTTLPRADTPLKIQGTGEEKLAGRPASGKTADEILTSSTVTDLTGRTQPWQYPPLSLLSDTLVGKADRGDVNANAGIIERTLDSFGITAKVVEANGGPAVTQYALEVATGTKLSRLTALSSDLALALAAPHGLIRIEAPIPGRNLVGIELPNRSPEFVPLRKVLESESMKHLKSKVAVALGLDVSGKPLATDISRMPHILIAGATGSGKSVAINAFIISMLFRASPDEVKFILVDPKRVELTQYNGIPHLMTPVIVEPKAVISALKWTIEEMEKRYKMFAEVGVRNIEGYHELAGFQNLPYLVILIDELADIMFFAPAEVEDTITRLAQMARATGLHLIVSTQRPSVDVITGLIKANIPCRIAFAVSSQIDSRVIIDQPGAEKLLGRGDMLYIPPDQAKPTRIQGAYVSDSDANRVIDFIKKQGVAPVYSPEVTSKPVTASGRRAGAGLFPSDSAGDVRDELFDEAVRVVCQHDRASASLLQRRLSIGYARAARVIDQLQAAGVVGPGEGSKPRDVLIRNAEEFLATPAQGNP
jgi:S-DNA-T family DNA segregation ATPase FtsK/SpoIIIE